VRPRPGTLERQARLTEGLLIFLVLLALALGAALSLVAKAKDAPPSDAKVLNVNTADAAKLARALGVPGDVGERIVRERKRHGGGFGDVDALGRIPISDHPREAAAKLNGAGIGTGRNVGTPTQIRQVAGLSASEAARFAVVRAAYPKAHTERVLATSLISSARLSDAKPGLVARTWPEAGRTFLQCCGALALFLLTSHFLLRRFRPRADPFLLPVAGLLSVLGVLLLWAIKDPVRDIPTYVAQTQGVVIGGGLALLAALSPWLSRAPLHRYAYVYALVAVAGTLLLGLFGAGPGGVRLSVAGAQPVEVIKILLVFFLAAYLAERAQVLNDPLRRWGPFPLPRRADAAPLLVLYTLPLALFAIVRDLGPVLLLFGTFLLLVYLATGRGVYVALGLIALFVGGWIGYKLQFGVFETRVEMWLSPWKNDNRSGDHLALGLWGMASGGPWGSGLGLGGPRFIPRAGSDLAFASLGEETGLWGTFAVVLCFLAVAVRGLRIARQAATDFERLLAAGLALLIAYQGLVIICGTLGLLPLTGITLPLVSYGKSSLVATFFEVGLLLALSAKPQVTAVAPTPPPEYRAASKRLGIFFAAAFLVVVGGRLAWVQALAADAIAGRLVRVPDADGVMRPHVNPRLLFLAQQIGRGRILDRNGKVLAETRSGKRVYPLGPATAHLIGYVDPAIGGPTGAEKQFENELHGFSTWASLVPVWRRKDSPGFRLPQGQDVTLALDADLQQIALTALQEGAASVRDRRTRERKDRGAVVVLDVATGGVLAAASSPTFDPNGLTTSAFQKLGKNNTDFPLINRVSGGYYPPGSTFKVVTATALFQHNAADFTFVCRHVDENVYWHANGGTTYARRRLADDESDRPHGRIGMTEAIVDSCNIYYAHGALTVGPEAMRDTAQQFGFTKLPSLRDTGAALPEVGFGQGPVLASPLEMAGVALTVAAGGKRLRPHYRLDDPAQVTATPLTPEQASLVASAMLGVTRSGTAAGRFDVLPFSVAGKTGTAQNKSYDRMSHSWFIGFAPADQPKVAFAVVVENGGYGASAAVPIAREVLRNAPGPLLGR
jgi:cell division protein FtsW (lipid II flippase)